MLDGIKQKSMTRISRLAGINRRDYGIEIKLKSGSRDQRTLLGTPICMNCCCVEKSSESRYHTVLNKKKSWVEFFRFASSFFNGCYILHLLKQLSTLENIATLSFPHICINYPLKAYFDYIKKPFVTINNIFIIGPCCCS